jgi:cell cycle serine/threonine-protein kinase CDC5/MSD2
MSAQVYSSLQPTASRRNPLANTVSHKAVNVKPFPRQPIPGTPPKPEIRATNPAEPSLQRQNAKVTPPSPPKVIIDKSQTVELRRVGLLGEVCPSE